MTTQRGDSTAWDRDEHRELRELLPWYVTRQLEAADAARIEAHLDLCAECQAEVRFEKRLEAEVSRLPLEVEAGWARMRRRVETEQIGGLPRWLRLPGPRLGWGLAAVLMLALGALLAPSLRPASTADGYHALGAAPTAEPGNLVVIFRPDATEASMREALRASGARLVDGPTPADAYVLRVPQDRRDRALASLRARREIVLAQPVDSGAAP